MSRAPTRLAVVLATGWSLACGAGAPQATEILWDSWGVPHVYGRTLEELFYANGWAMMVNHGDLALRLYGQARGRAAEFWGERFLDGDRWVRLMDVPGRAQAWYAAQPAEFRRLLDAFAAGVNAYVAAHPERIADAMEVVVPVDARDILAHAQRVLNFTFLASPGIVRAAQRHLTGGSNAWAIGPKRSASGHAMLLANPHLPWSDLFTWFELQLVGPGVDVYGVTLVGFPGVGIGFNDRLGWTHTVNTIDGADLYELTLVEGGYRFDGAVRPFDERSEILRVRQDDGSVRDDTLQLAASVHGPVVAREGARALALRVASLDAPHALSQWWAMSRAQDLAEFEAALRRNQIPLFTVVYADRAGHIMHLFGGRVPARGRGDWTYWDGIVTGDSSTTLWTDVHPYDDLPRVVDPPSGWVQNANEPPWTATLPPPLDPAAYPRYLAPIEPADPALVFRPQRSRRMLLEDDSISFEELIAAKHSTRMELADRIIDDLLAAAGAHGGDLAREAAAVLAAWDRSANADSRGAVLFAAWADAYDVARGFATRWSLDEPQQGPDGLADPSRAALALESAAREVRARHGALDVPWGDVHRLRVAGRDLPGNGADGEPFGVFRVVNYAPARDDGVLRATAGDSWIAAVEFSDPVRARVALAYGNASQPASPHAGDQLELFARGELREAWRTRPAIEAHLESREHLPPREEPRNGN